MFNYTEKWDNLDSSLVQAVYFDRKSGQTLVELQSGSSYVYDNTTYGDALSLTSAPSVGRAYNYFRKRRPRGAGGRPFAGATAKRGGLVTVGAPGAPAQPVRASGGMLTSSFEVTYSVDGREYKSSVTASDLVAAAQDVATKAQSLGLNAKLTGVVVKR